MRDCVSYMQSSSAERMLKGLSQHRAEANRLRRDRFQHRHPDFLRRDPGHPESVGSDAMLRLIKLRRGE